MSNLSVFAADYDGQPIRATQDGRFSIYDVLTAFGVAKMARNAPEVWKRIMDRYPDIVNESAMYQFPGKGQRLTPVADKKTCDKVLRIIGKYPGQSPITSDKYYPRTESQIIAVLWKAFEDLNPIPQFCVHGYRIDLYLAIPNIAIEVDEKGHQNYSKVKESQREKAIKSALGCSFVRFDPYIADFNIGCVIRQVRNLL